MKRKKERGKRSKREILKEACPLVKSGFLLESLPLAETLEKKWRLSFRLWHP